MDIEEVMSRIILDCLKRKRFKQRQLILAKNEKKKKWGFFKKDKIEVPKVENNQKEEFIPEPKSFKALKKYYDF